MLKDDDTCVGIQCIVDRTLPFFGVGCSAAGLSYTAIRPDYQNSDGANLIKHHLFEYIENNSDVSFGFARKALDNYWYPYGYRGITNFCEITLEVARVFASDDGVVSKPVTSNDLTLVNKFYSDLHVNMLGPLIRTEKLWKYYLEKCKRNRFQIRVVYIDNEPIGYYMRNGSIVYEVGYELGRSKQVFSHIVCELRKAGCHEITFKIGKDHPMVGLINQYEYSIKTRFAWRGGHILRITSVFDFLQKIAPVLESRARVSNLQNFNFSCNSINFSYSRQGLRITRDVENKSSIQFDNNEWVKLIFGACEPKLLNRYHGDCKERLLSVLFPISNPQFLEIDHL
jgi:predicted acetyltransferase